MIPFERLVVAERAHELTLAVFRETNAWPERVLVIQLRRAVLSVPSNIAEGAARESRAEFARFVAIALSSAAEAHYQLRLARDLGHLPPPRHTALSDELEQIKRMLGALLRTLRRAGKAKRPGPQGPGRPLDPRLMTDDR